MTREQKIELCRIYNNSDIDCFNYMQQFCNKEQMELLDRLVTLDMETDIGWGNEPSTSEEVDEYYNGKWKLLNDFGIENVNGDAYFEGNYYEQIVFSSEWRYSDGKIY